MSCMSDLLPRMTPTSALSVIEPLLPSVRRGPRRRGLYLTRPASATVTVILQGLPTGQSRSETATGEGRPLALTRLISPSLGLLGDVLPEEGTFESYPDDS